MTLELKRSVPKGYITKITTIIGGSMTDEVQETAADLEAKLAAIRQQEADEREAATANPLLDQVKAAPGDAFIDKLRAVAANLKEAGKLGESEVLAGGEEGSVVATLIKLVGEIVDHV